MIEAVIFDLDGTLITFTLDVVTCRTEIIQRLTEQNFPRFLFSTKETAFDMLIKVKKHLKAKGKEDQNFLNIKKMVFSIVERFELRAARTTQLFSGIPETLKLLKDMNLKLALCTISGDKAVKQILHRFSVEHFFDAVLPRELVSAVKPDPIHLRAALAALKVRTNEAVLVGDSIKDIACASQLKVIAVGVTTGLSSQKELTDAGANYIASSANDLPKLILKLNEQAL